MGTNEIQNVAKNLPIADTLKSALTVENITKTIAKTSGAVGGVLAGGASFAAVGSLLGPVGAAAGFAFGLASGAVGGWKFTKFLVNKTGGEKQGERL